MNLYIIDDVHAVNAFIVDELLNVSILTGWMGKLQDLLTWSI